MQGRNGAALHFGYGPNPMRIALLTSLLLACGSAIASDLVFIAPTNHAEPLARFEQGRLSGGLLKDLGEALAKRTGQKARFLPMPSKRVGAALRAGEADMVCYVRPGWIEGDFVWVEDLIPDAGLVVAHPRSAPIAQLTDLRGRSIGTVLGYRYQELEGTLGTDFQRVDARDTGSNLDKLAAGLVDYAFVERSAFLAFQRKHPDAGLREVLQVLQYQTGCALARRSPQLTTPITQALQAMRASGELAKILAPYGL